MDEEAREEPPPSGGPHPRRTVGAATGLERRRMERFDLKGRFCPKADMGAALRRDRRHAGTPIDPELGIVLAETDGRRTRHQPRQPERRQRRFIEARGSFEIADGDGDMVDHLRSIRYLTVIPGRCEASNPESRDSPTRNCASEVWSFGPSRNDELNLTPARRISPACRPPNPSAPETRHR